MRYFIGIASKNHIQIGQAGGFCQLCHGKAAPRMESLRKQIAFWAF
ncbi:hypothetical protein [Helicobacter sp. UBA3407]|nr:hypothetical protein [Helicobacter sp. UBA3407]